MKQDMTEGNPLRLLFAFAVPLFFGNVLQQTYNIVDAMIVGRILGADALASVGGTSSVQYLMLGFCIGNCCGFGIPIAKYFGAGEERMMKSRIFHSLILSVFLALVMTILSGCAMPLILKLLNTPEEIYQDTYRYLFIIFMGIPCTILYNLMASILRSLGDSKTPFVFLCVSTVLNIVLDVFCIVVLNLGVFGAAAATVFSQGISGLLCLIVLVRRKTIFHFEAGDCRFSWKTAGEMMGIGIPLGLESSITAIGMMVMQSANNSLGSIYISGFTAAMKIKQFAMCPFNAFGTSITVFCSQNYGAKKMDRIRDGIRKGFVAAILYGILAGLVLIFFGRTLAMLFISSEETEILAASAQYLRWMGYLYWVLGILFVALSALQGLGKAGLSVISGTVEMLSRTTICFALLHTLGFSAICMADQTAWIFASCYLVPTLFVTYKKISKKLQNESKEGCV